jgi:hypothetical protein
MPRLVASVLLLGCLGLLVPAGSGCSGKKSPPTIAEMLARARKAKTPEAKARELAKVAAVQAGADKTGAAKTLAEAASAIPADGQPLACVPVLVEIATTYATIGERASGQKAVATAIEMTKRLEDPLGRAQLLAAIGAVQGSREQGLGDRAAAEATLAEAATLAGSDVPERFRGKALAAVASGYADAGLATAAKDMIGTLEDLARGLTDLRPKAEAFAAAAAVRAAAGEREAAENLLAEAAKAAKAIDDFPGNRAYALVAVAKAFKAAGDQKGAAALLAEAEKAASKVGDPQQQQDALRAVRQLQAGLK